MYSIGTFNNMRMISEKLMRDEEDSASDFIHNVCTDKQIISPIVAPLYFRIYFSKIADFFVMEIVPPCGGKVPPCGDTDGNESDGLVL